MDEDLELPAELEERLNILTHVVELLGIDDVSFASYSMALYRLIDESFSLSRTLNRLRFAEEELKIHLASTKHELQLISHWNETIKSGQSSEENTASIERRREVLLKKAKEYHKELEAAMAEMPEPRVTVTQLIKQQEKNKLLEQEIEIKRAKVAAFQGLPPNLELARHELRNARNEQMELIQLRERLLGRMAAGVA